MGRGVRSVVGDRVLLLSEVARLYYVEDLTQAAIARRMGISRSNVSRMLRDARERGLVEIKVHSPLRTVPALQDEMTLRLGLQRCLVLAGSDSGARTSGGSGVAALAALYMQEVVEDGTIVGLGWGRSVYLVVHSGFLRRKKGVRVVQIMGSVGGSIPDLDGVSITARLADILGASAHYLHTPMLVASREVRDGLLRDPHISETLRVARRADVMVAGIGGINRDFGQYRTGYLREEDLEYIRGEGVVGEVCGIYFSSTGEVLRLEMNERMIAIGHEDVLRIPHRVGVSWGEGKVLPNIGAARAGLINVLITDEETASGMLRFLERKERV